MPDMWPGEPRHFWATPDSLISLCLDFELIDFTVFRSGDPWGNAEFMNKNHRCRNHLCVCITNDVCWGRTVNKVRNLKKNIGVILKAFRGARGTSPGSRGTFWQHRIVWFHCVLISDCWISLLRNPGELHPTSHPFLCTTKVRTPKAKPSWGMMLMDSELMDFGAVLKIW